MCSGLHQSPACFLSFFPGPPPPHSELFRVRICLFPPFESTPLSPDWQHFWTPLSRAFRRLFLPWRPPKSRTLLNVPPIFYFITPFLNFSGVQRERERKPTPFFKEISRWKVKYPPFFFFYNSRAGLFRTKSTPLPEILGTRMRFLRPRSGGGGAGLFCTLRSTGGGGTGVAKATHVYTSFRKLSINFFSSIDFLVRSSVHWHHDCALLWLPCNWRTGGLTFYWSAFGQKF